MTVEDIKTIEEALLRIEELRMELRELDAMITASEQTLKAIRAMRHQLANEIQKLLFWVQRYEARREQVATTYAEGPSPHPEEGSQRSNDPEPDE